MSIASPTRRSSCFWSVLRVLAIVSMRTRVFAAIILVYKSSCGMRSNTSEYIEQLPAVARMCLRLWHKVRGTERYVRVWTAFNMAAYETHISHLASATRTTISSAQGSQSHSRLINYSIDCRKRTRCGSSTGVSGTSPRYGKYSED